MTQTTPVRRFPTSQKFKFEVELGGVGMDFSMGKMTDEVRKALNALNSMALSVRVECVAIEVETNK